MGGGWWKPNFSLLGWEFTNKLKKEVKWSIRQWMKVGNVSMNSCEFSCNWGWLHRAIFIDVFIDGLVNIHIYLLSDETA